MLKILIKYAAAVTAAKPGAENKDAMIAAGMAALSESEASMMALGSMPTWKGQINDAAWAGKTFSAQWPDVTLAPEVKIKLDEALTPQEP